MRLIAKDDKKLQKIFDNDIDVKGLMLDIRRLLSARTTYIRSVIELLEKNPSSILLVDPRTDSFQVDSSVRQIFPTLKRIYKLIGIKENEVSNDEIFTPMNISTKIERLTDKVFEVSKIHIVDRTINPTYFIPPYFVSSSIDAWYSLTLRAINYAIDKYDHPILAPIAVDVSFLSNGENIRQALSDYSQMNVDGYLILPYDLDEYRSPYGILHNLASLVIGLKRSGKKVFVHSAEFGTVLLSLGVDAIISGMCIRRTPRKPSLIEGISEIGQVEVHVYTYKLFNKLIHYKFVMLLQLFPEIYQCECPLCKYYKDENYLSLPEESDYDDLSLHYVYWKNIEAKEYSNNSKKLINDLEGAKEIIEQYNEKVAGKYFFSKNKQYEYKIYSNYIDKWLRILETFGQRDSINL